MKLRTLILAVSLLAIVAVFISLQGEYYDWRGDVVEGRIWNDLFEIESLVTANADSSSSHVETARKRLEDFANGCTVLLEKQGGRFEKQGRGSISWIIGWDEYDNKVIEFYRGDKLAPLNAKYIQNFCEKA